MHLSEALIANMVDDPIWRTDDGVWMTLFSSTVGPMYKVATTTSSNRARLK
jgi:hypothetical protein